MATHGVGVRVDGLSATVRNLQKLGVEADDLKDAMKRIADHIAPDYARHVPTMTGRLRGDLRTNRAKSTARLMIGRASIPYAGPVNYGVKTGNVNFKHGRSTTAVRGSYRGAHFVAKGDATAAPKASTQLELELSKLITSLNLG